MKKKVLFALGGNALLRAKEKGTAEEQLAHVEKTCAFFLKIIEEGYSIAITHGNGPQVGNILLQNELSKETIPSMPLDICGAESQGLIGYMIQRQLSNKLKMLSREIPVITILSQVLVKADDPAFSHPTKPIGPFYTQEESKKREKELHWSMVEQVGKGYRRVVPSPEPVDIVEGKIIKKLIDEGNIVISCGGGGIPVVLKGGQLIGVEAVIDKDHTAAVLGKVIHADILMILTDVEKVAIRFGKPDQQNLDHLTLEQARVYMAAGEFSKGSMGPKVEAACNFIKQGGKKAIITSLEKAKEALEGKTGTSFSK
jgi:carbamate kinase